MLIPTLAFKEYIGCLEPMGPEHIFEFKRHTLSTSTIEQSNQIIARISMVINNEDGEVEVGVPILLLKKLLPKCPETSLEVSKGLLDISGDNYSATVRTIDIKQCRRPTKPMIYPEFSLPVNPSAFYEKVKSISEVFSGKDRSLSFTFETEKEHPNLIYLGDFDDTVGSVDDSIACLGTPPAEIKESYPYDTVKPVLDAVRHLTQSVNLHFMPMPGGGCNALVVVGHSDNPDNTINFMYVLAPRLRT